MDKQQELFELIGSANINLDNLADAIPGLRFYPMFNVVKYQLNEAEKLLKGEEKTA